jgi:hypothetical protein
VIVSLLCLLGRLLSNTPSLYDMIKVQTDSLLLLVMLLRDGRGVKTLKKIKVHKAIL